MAVSFCPHHLLGFLVKEQKVLIHFLGWWLPGKEDKTSVVFWVSRVTFQRLGPKSRSRMSCS